MLIIGLSDEVARVEDWTVKGPFKDKDGAGTVSDIDPAAKAGLLETLSMLGANV